MPVHLRHPEPANGITLEVELDQNCRLVTDDPPIMSRFDGNGLWSYELKRTAIRVLNVDLAASQEPDMRVHAEICANDRLHVRGPAKTGLVDHALHAAGAGPHDIDLGTADFAAFATRPGCKQWIVVAHAVLHADSSVAVEFYQYRRESGGCGVDVARDGTVRLDAD